MNLTKEQLTSNLRLGKSIEQWLSYIKENDYAIINWLRIDKEKDDMYSVSYFEVFDEGSEEFIDIYEFSKLDPDEPYGIINTFNSVEESLEFATRTYGASIDKFVSGGMIQEEYRDYLRR